MEQNETLNPLRRVAIIGAGVSGLGCARRFTEGPVKDKFQVIVYEQSDRVGGTWVYTPNVGVDETTGLPVHSSMYNNLRTNLPKECMQFPDFPYGAHLDGKSYVTWREVLRYLDEFTDHYNLNRLIQFNHVVLSISRRHDRWKVRVKDIKIDASYEEEFDIVIVCSGHNSVPNLPTYEGADIFKGDQQHSHDYRLPDKYRDKNVLVVGFGPSGVDIGMDVEKVAKSVILSHHIKVAFDHQIGDAIIQKPDVKRILEDSVVFEDETTYPIDAILYCTGYKFRYDFLTPSCELNEDYEMVGPLYKMLININIPTIGFIAITSLSIIFPLVDLQAQFYLKYLLGEVKLPDKATMLAEYEEEIQEKLKRGVKKKHLHILGEAQRKYVTDLSVLAGGTIGIPSVILDIYDHSGRERKKFNFTKYRNFVYTIIDDENFEVYEPEETQL